LRITVNQRVLSSLLQDGYDEIRSSLAELSAFARPASWREIPWRVPQFWATQVLVIVIAALHVVIEAFGLNPYDHSLYFVPVSFFFIPVVYAAVTFGSRGAVPTALWCTVLTMPTWWFWREGPERFGAVFQMWVVVTVAVFVGTRVDRQQRARREAEAASRAFDTSGDGVLVIAADQRIAECNPAAARVLGRPAEALRGQRLDAVLPAHIATLLTQAIAQGAPASDFTLRTAQGDDVWIEPVCRPLPGEGNLTHMVLRDVTAQKLRQQHLETYAARVLNAQEDERKRVAQELHDETIQSLIQLCRMLDRVDTPGAESPALIRRYTESIVDDVRRFIQGLRPPILDDFGLGEAVRRLTLDFAERSEIGAALHVTGCERRLRPEIELALFRIAQEALSNVARHSRARSVVIHLDYGDDEIMLAVTDDGQGFIVPTPPGELLAEQTLGLLGMLERARAVGGSFDIQSGLDGGTVVTAHAPTEPSIGKLP
jgi:PAS domain S-box-containing protein